MDLNRRNAPSESTCTFWNIEDFHQGACQGTWMQVCDGYDTGTLEEKPSPLFVRHIRRVHLVLLVLITSAMVFVYGWTRPAEINTLDFQCNPIFLLL
jgi:hypothetical protein